MIRVVAAWWRDREKRYTCSDCGVRVAYAWRHPNDDPHTPDPVVRLCDGCYQRKCSAVFGPGRYV